MVHNGSIAGDMGAEYTSCPELHPKEVKLGLGFRVFGCQGAGQWQPDPSVGTLSQCLLVRLQGPFSLQLQQP